jgi:cytosine/adenosine deaminase-related metal-dependent hydrolase
MESATCLSNGTQALGQSPAGLRVRASADLLSLDANEPALPGRGGEAIPTAGSSPVPRSSVCGGATEMRQRRPGPCAEGDCGAVSGVYSAIGCVIGAAIVSSLYLDR